MISQGRRPFCRPRSNRRSFARHDGNRKRTDVQEVPTHPLIETLVAFLKNKAMLLILDNCEHVIDQAAAVADFLLRACPNLRILATSREPLRTAGERAYRLPSLDGTDAVALFADRAQAADAHFALTPENRSAVEEICAQLAGIPLAIELAAARASVLPLSVLTKEFDDRFGVLVGSQRTAPPRQQRMRATIDWSYELLAAPEQRCSNASRYSPGAVRSRRRPPFAREKALQRTTYCR